MANKMLIDAAHPEETRVVVLRGNRVEDFDFESASKKPLRGNIYLAKVTRVEPSLQAAFIEYGGNRHGFLAFSEIHPDYYQIPVADRQALLEEEARAHREEEDEQRHSGPRRSRRRRHGSNGRGRGGGDEAAAAGETEADEAAELAGQDEGETGSDDIEPASLLTPEAAAKAMGEEAEAGEAGGEPDLPGLDPEEEAGAPEAESAAGPENPDPANPDDAARSPALPAAAHQASNDRIVSDVEPITEGEGPDGEPVVVAEIVELSAPDEPDEETDEAEAIENGSEVDPGEDESAEEDAAPDENGAPAERPVEQLGGDALEDVPVRAPRLRRHYKIQEVIKRRQILLVQVVKEERGNKGAALTTYLSLAGRYSVLMPNTARGGGISRKITDAEDRKRLKAIAGELDVPEGMGIILRTAGAARGEGEVKRDFEYLLRMWETVRELTLRSTAPTLVYEEGSLIKRAIRDLFSKEIDEIQVAGEDGYKEARDFMRLLMPTHVRSVVPYRDSQPIFAKAGAEAQLDAMFSNHVTLKSGGYLVINQTEALVAIDVNSGRSTREHNIEDTALRTNLEAADEVARQLRLRDLAGLIVVDFIDMEEGRNNRAVERRLKDALKNDRARIQIGHISHFGLLEMSRQRIRTGVLEGSTVLCPHCAGAGTVRSTASIALHVLRVLEDHLIRSASFNLIVRTRMEVALYILNQKRAHLNDLESRFGAGVTVMADATLTGTIYHAIERGEPAVPPAVAAVRAPALGTGDMGDDLAEEALLEDDEEGVDAAAEAAEAEGAERTAEGEGGDRRRRRRRRRRGRDRDTRGRPVVATDAEQPSDVGLAEGGEDDFEAAELEGEDGAVAAGDETADGVRPTVDEPAEVEAVEPAEDGKDEAPRRRRSRRSAPRERAEALPEQPEGEEPAPRRSRRRSRAGEGVPSLAADMPAEPSADRDVGADTVKNHPADAPDMVATARVDEADAIVAAEPLPPEPAVAEPPEAAPLADEPPRPKRSGWWQRAKATITGE